MSATRPWPCDGTEVYDRARRFHLTLSREDETTIIEARVEPGGGVPVHAHPRQSEQFTVLDGQVSFRVGRSRLQVGPGEQILVPAGTRHSFTNRSGADVTLRARLTPGENAEAFFVDAARASDEELFTRSGIPKSWRALVRGAELLSRYGDEVVLANPPPALQRLFVPIVIALSGSRR